VEVLEGNAVQVEPVVVVRGDVPEGAVGYATDKLVSLQSRITAPLLFCRIKLTMAADPAVSRPADAQLTLDVNGEVVRGHVAATTMNEAIDLVEARVLDKLSHRAERRAWRRRRTVPTGPGMTWPELHVAVHSAPPVDLDEPVIVRRKSLAAGELTAEEAAFDMTMLDYGFFLFRDLATGDDCVVARDGAGGFTLQHRDAHTVADADSWSVAIAAAPTPAPVLSAAEAVGLLDAAEAPFVFFSDVASGRGSVVYRRFDGNYGLVTMVD
jgi:hypothetical protein